MKAAVTITLVTVGISICFAAFLTMPLYGQWTLISFGQFGAGILGALMAVAGISLAIMDREHIRGRRTASGR